MRTLILLALAGVAAAQDARAIRLKGMLRGCDRIRVVSLAKPAKKLFEVTARDEVEATVAAIGFVRRTSGRGCSHRASLMIEFYRRKKLLVAVGLVHGRWLRSAAAWRGDSTLTFEARAKLATWMGRHGVREPLRQHRKLVAKARAGAIRLRRWERLVPKEQFGVFATFRVRGHGVLIKTLRSISEDKVERAATYLRLFGCFPSEWRLDDTLDMALKAVLGETDPETLGDAIRRVIEEPWGAEGAARWIIGSRKWEQVSKAVLDQVLPVLARRALRHPRIASRIVAMTSLANQGGEQAVHALRSAMAGVEPWGLPPDELEPPLATDWGCESNTTRMKVSERAFAAGLLSRLDDRASLPAIRKLRETAPKRDHGELDKAIARLSRD